MNNQKVIWVKPFDPENHNAETEGRAGLCGWHGTNQGTPCEKPPFAGVKFDYAAHPTLATRLAAGGRD
ncbi:hypothetical protein [Nonomuraea jiangxiensis]|uniref:Uncharacterized protein n=1 Tax=Nonomuraea jiangxiensis TaxID=633440 RepID=A0A1G8XYX2_9ACTN|nr:hypothetical protein [Nonomuraea jiangxiensis]SDJ95085.1 hypothetical protein SAMN05421869_113102 [Nonomuraea jiangxiensis]